MMPPCDQTGVPGLVGFTHFHSSTTSGSASLISVRILLRVFPRQSPSSAILFEMSPDADWPWLASDFFIFSSWPGSSQIYQSHSRRPAEGNKLADAAVPQVQAAPGENSYDHRNRRARRVCDPQMSGHRAAEIAGHHDCREDRRLRDEVEHHQRAFRNDNGDDGRFGIAIARNNFGHRVGVVSSPEPSAAQQLRDHDKGQEPAGPEHPAGNGDSAGGCSKHWYLRALGCASTLRGGGRPVGRFNAELLCVLGIQSLPAAELHRLGTNDAAEGGSAEKVIQHIEANVPPGSTHRDEAAIDVDP